MRLFSKLINEIPLDERKAYGTIVKDQSDKIKKLERELSEARKSRDRWIGFCRHLSTQLKLYDKELEHELS